MAEKRSNEVEWAIGYSNAIFLALKTHLETLPSRKREKFVSDYKVNCERLREILHLQHPDPEQMLLGFDFAAEGLTVTDKEWQTLLDQSLRDPLGFFGLEGRSE